MSTWHRPFGMSVVVAFNGKQEAIERVYDLLDRTPKAAE